MGKTHKQLSDGGVQDNNITSCWTKMARWLGRMIRTPEQKKWKEYVVCKTKTGKGLGPELFF